MNREYNPGLLFQYFRIPFQLFAQPEKIVVDCTKEFPNAAPVRIAKNTEEFASIVGDDSAKYSSQSIIPEGAYVNGEVVINAEAEQVKEIRDDKGRLLAPNGQPSNLNERQWKQVRTPSFKKWFGDWEKVLIREFLNSKPVAVLSGEEFEKIPGVRFPDRLEEFFSEKYNNNIVSSVLGM